MKQPLAIILVGLAAAALFGGLVHAVLVAALLVPLVARIRAEERLLREHFGAEYDVYCRRTWRLVPWIC
jgi:protein-S-isoprenylcysteine O-methyltransferase Ste14